MEALVAQIVEKTGIPEDVARAVIGIVLDFLKARLPKPVAAQIDSVLGGGDLGDTAKGLAEGLGLFR